MKTDQLSPQERLLREIFNRGPFDKVTSWVWDRTDTDHPHGWQRPVLAITAWMSDFDFWWAKRKPVRRKR